MATPTPGSASKRPGGGGGVSTPSHLNQSSPAPRSVPSPNTARHHPAGKTPINHPTSGSSHGSKTVSGTPMVQNLSQSGNSASPGINALGTPALGGLGIEGITPSALHNISTPLAFAMSRSDSELRMANIATKRNEDEERRVKMRKVLKSIGRAKGRVGEEGIVRLARRVGLVSDIDDEKLTQEERERKVGNRSFSVAGDSIIVTVDLRDHIPHSVEVNGDVPEAEEAARVLSRDLRDSSDVALTANLDRFAVNLSYLAQMDRLKKETDTACFSAIGGLYQSLHRLREKEVQAANRRMNADKAETDVTCRKGGRPTMHARQTLGFSLDYWQQSRYSGEESAADESRMDLDEAEKASHQDEDVGIWRLLVGAEKRNTAGMQHMPLRVSDRWLPEDFELPSENSEESIKWLEPDHDHQGVLKPCFIATLDPPVVLPYGVADVILKNFDVHSVPEMQSIPSYVSLLLSTASGHQPSPLSVSSEAGSITSRQDVVSLKHGEQVLVQHQYTLDSAKPDFGFLLRELPFSHPKQLVELMPTLRQWAGLGLLLSQSFDTGSVSGNDSAKGSKPGHVNHQAITLESIDKAPSSTETRASTPFSIVLSTAPQPTLNITFRSDLQGSSVAKIDVRILQIADVAVEVIEGFGFSTDDTRAKAEARMAKALDVCWDLGVWLEWVKGQYS